MHRAGMIANPDEDVQKDRALATNDCIQTERLQTPFEADTVVYGTMFTVQATVQSLTILTMEIAVNPVGAEMDVEVYTKLGDFQGFESDPSQWKRVVNTALIPGREGRGTIISTDQFEKLIMQTGEIRSFFITMKTSDLRYKRGDDNVVTGRSFLSDGYLSVNSGIGLAEYGFNNQIIPSRLFTGILFYSHETDCNAPSSKVTVAYSFYARLKGNDSSSRDDVVSRLNGLVSDAVLAILGSQLSSIRDEHKIDVDSVVCATSPSELADCPIVSWPECFLMDCMTTLTHLSTIAGGHLKYLLIDHSDDLTALVQKSELDVEYSGFHTLKTSLLVAFQGVPSNVALENDQMHFFQEVAAEYAAGQTVGVMDATIVGVTITHQRGPDMSQRKLQTSPESSSSDGWIELTIDILAFHLPPYTGADFQEIVLSSFSSHKNYLVDDLKAARSRPDSLLQGGRADFFEGITQVNVRSIDDGMDGDSTDPNASATGQILGMSTLAFSAICVALIVFTGVWIWCVNRKSTKGNTDSGEIVFVDSTGKQRRRASVMFMFGDSLPTTTNQKGVKIGQAFLEENDVPHNGSMSTVPNDKDVDRSFPKRSNTSLKNLKPLSSQLDVGGSRHTARATRTTGIGFDVIASSHNRYPVSLGDSETNHTTRATRTAGTSFDPVLGGSSHTTRATRITGTGLKRTSSLDMKATSHNQQLASFVDSDLRLISRTSSLDMNALSNNQQAESFTNSNVQHTTRVMRTTRGDFDANVSSHVRQVPSAALADPRHTTRAMRTTGGGLDANTSSHTRQIASAVLADSRHTTREMRTTGGGLDANASSHNRQLVSNTDSNLRPILRTSSLNTKSSSNNEQPASFAYSNVQHTTRATRTTGGDFDANASYHTRQVTSAALADSRHTTRAMRTMGGGLDANASSHTRQVASAALADSRHTTRAMRTTGSGLETNASSHTRQVGSTALADSRHTSQATRTTGGDFDANVSYHTRQVASTVLLADSRHTTRATRTMGGGLETNASSHTRQVTSAALADSRHTTRAVRTMGGGLETNASSHTRQVASGALADSRHTTRAMRTTGSGLETNASSHTRQVGSTALADSRHTTRATRTTGSGFDRNELPDALGSNTTRGMRTTGTGRM